MIFETLTDSNPMELLGMAVKVQSTNISVVTEDYSPAFCYCLYECPSFYPVWGGGSTWQNDTTTFLFKRQIDVDTHSITLWKNGIQVATISDNSYGVYNISYTDDTLQYSYIADWDLIYTAFGSGSYQIKNAYTSIGEAREFESRDFDLYLFDDVSANGWVKFNWTQTGIISSSDFTFTEGVDFSFKMQGNFIKEKPETIKDSYQTSAFQSKQFRTEQKNKYSFNSKFTKSTDFRMVNENLALADYVSITDFNLYGTNIRDRDFDFIEISDINDFMVNRNMVMTLQFGDYEQNIIKTNC